VQLPVFSLHKVDDVNLCILTCSRSHCSPLQIGKGVVRRQGRDVCLLAYGSSVNEAMAAAEALQLDGVSATVIDARFCKPLDTVGVLENIFA